jgi:aspartate/methionine/tyrosine aminotransferase
VVELHSLGKLFSLGPLGLAFFVGAEQPLARIAQYSDFAWTQIDALRIRTAIRCLEDWAHVERRASALRERLARLRETLRSLGFEPYPTPAGIYLLCRLPGSLGGRAVASAAEAAERLLSDHDLAVAPWEAGGQSYLRFAVSYLQEELEALARLGSGFAGPAD